MSEQGRRGGAREQAGRKGGGGREREGTIKRGALAAPQHRARKGKEEVKMGGESLREDQK